MNKEASFKKFTLEKNIRIVSIALLLLVVLALTFFLIKETKYPAIREEELKSYSYKSTGDVAYSVYLKPNDVYENQIMDKDQIYMTNYVDSINAQFKYDFKGDKTADLHGSYEIYAVLEGYIENDKEKISIWNKRYQMLEKTDFQKQDIGFSISKDVMLNLQEYQDFISKIAEDTKVNATNALAVYMKVHIEADTDKGKVEEDSEPVLAIPIGGTYFKASKLGAGEKPGEIKEVKRIQLPVNKNIVIMISIAIGVLVLALLFLLLFTSGKSGKDLIKKKLDRIFKQHGSRMVAMKTAIAAGCEKSSKVKSIEDIVKIADEIGKPILYQYSTEYKDITKFSVVDNNHEYYYDLIEDIDQSFIEINKSQGISV